MTLFKISIHCGQVNTYVIEDHENKEKALNKWHDVTDIADRATAMQRVGDVLINPKQITFIVVEEVIDKEEEPKGGAVIEG